MAWRLQSTVVWAHRSSQLVRLLLSALIQWKIQPTTLHELHIQPNLSEHIYVRGACMDSHSRCVRCQPSARAGRATAAAWCLLQQRCGLR